MGQGARDALGDAAERHVHDAGDIAIAQTVGAQIQALPVAIRERAQRRLHARVLDFLGQLPVRRGSRIHQLHRRRLIEGIGRRQSPTSPLAEREIVRDLKHPAAQVVLRAAPAQMTEERQKHFLDDIFGHGGFEPESPDIAHETEVIAIEERQDERLDVGFAIACRRKGRSKGEIERLGVFSHRCEEYCTAPGVNRM